MLVLDLKQSISICMGKIRIQVALDASFLILASETSNFSKIYFSCFVLINLLASAFTRQCFTSASLGCFHQPLAIHHHLKGSEDVVCQSS